MPSADADDAAQHVFWIAAQKLDSIKEGSERAFVFATARGVAANARRSVKRRRHDIDLNADTLESLTDANSNPEQSLARAEAVAMLERVFARMPPDLREVFVLFELEELTMATIGEVLEIPTGTVASRLRRARAEFEALVAMTRSGER